MESVSSHSQFQQCYSQQIKSVNHVFQSKGRQINPENGLASNGLSILQRIFIRFSNLHSDIKRCLVTFHPHCYNLFVSMGERLDDIKRDLLDEREYDILNIEEVPNEPIEIRDCFLQNASKCTIRYRMKKIIIKDVE